MLGTSGRLVSYQVCPTDYWHRLYAAFGVAESPIDSNGPRNTVVSSHRPLENVPVEGQQPIYSLPIEERFRLAKKGPTLIFDGVCNLCNASMRWYRERLLVGDAVFFMWAQHKDTQELLLQLGIGTDINKSWVYLKEGIVYRGSSAWLYSMEHLCAPWRWLGSFSYVPEMLRETAYGVVSKNRYDLVGKSDMCQYPTPEMKSRFLHDPVPQSADDFNAEALPATMVSAGVPDRKRLLVIGCGPAGIQVVRSLSDEFEIYLVEPKDYYEFTPGILRGLCDLNHLRSLHVPLSEALRGLNVRHIRGQVVGLREWVADINVVDLGDDHSTGSSVGTFIECPFDYAVVAVGSQYAGSSLWKVTGAPGEEAETSLLERVKALTRTRQGLLDLREQGGTAVLVGAGLVGVELAAEIAHYLPGLRVVLADIAPTVLPPLPSAAQDYARWWLENHGVELRLGMALPRGGTTADVGEALGINGDVQVFSCVGVSMRCSFMAPLGCLTERGAIRVNGAMQVLTDRASAEDVACLGPERATVCGAGRIFALGDCVWIDGLASQPTKDIYPAEAMAEVVVANLRLAKTSQSVRSCPGVLREVKASLQQMTLCSLGPDDCIFVMNGYLVSTGFFATNLKHQIEVTKMGQIRNELWGSLVWKFMPHW